MSAVLRWSSLTATLRSNRYQRYLRMGKEFGVLGEKSVVVDSVSVVDTASVIDIASIVGIVS